MRAKQLTELAKRAAPGLAETTAALWPEVAPIAARAQLPLVNLALPALRQLRSDEFEQFSQAMQWLIESDDQIEIFEFVLQKIVRRHLASQSGETRPTSIQYDTLKPLVRDCSVVLSALANVSSSNAGEVEKGIPGGRALSGGAGRRAATPAARRMWAGTTGYRARPPRVGRAANQKRI